MIADVSLSIDAKSSVPSETYMVKMIMIIVLLLINVIVAMSRYITEICSYFELNDRYVDSKRMNLIEYSRKCKKVYSFESHT